MICRGRHQNLMAWIKDVLYLKIVSKQNDKQIEKKNQNWKLETAGCFQFIKRGR